MQCQGTQMAALIAHHLGRGHIIQLKQHGDRAVVKISYVDIEIERSARDLWDALSAASYEMNAAIAMSPIGEDEGEQL